MTFPDLSATLRSDASFRANVYEEYHTGRTPLEELSVDLVDQFPLDYMHLICLGVMKQLLLFWIKGNIAIRMTKEDYNSSIVELEKFRKFIHQRDFSRMPRSLQEIDRWKASEFRQFLLYTGPIILKNKLKDDQYTHFMSLHCAVRILTCEKLCLEYNEYAKQLLKYFVENFDLLYGPEYIGHNVHNLIHIPNDAVRFGVLDNFSAFKFENHMSEIKNMLKTSNRPLEQFINRTFEKRAY
ncbi:hypothetical protein PPYR_01881 [Photinus pyralis]|uniref:DUF4218 domain-containing protein n=1 Tax=Photinus pyralis TaxID=7054 RepID=A0A5N4B5M2_PHOPY|nr:hypothetical protein PPYR_01881 [Photinus pyralis]